MEVYLSKKILIGVVFLFFVLMIILPPIIHSYIYPSVGDDNSLHMTIIKNGNLFGQMYFAYIVIGYPMRWISSITSLDINNLYLWFTYIVMIGIGGVFYFIMTKLVNYKAGLLSLIIPFFLSLGIWKQFNYGMIPNLINVEIILPFLIYFIILWLINRRNWQWMVVIGLTILFSLFHTTGIYLTLLIIVSIIGYILFNRKKIDWQVVRFLSSIFFFNIIWVIILGIITKRIFPQPNH
jgi:hypothetical protein